MLIYPGRRRIVSEMIVPIVDQGEKDEFVSSVNAALVKIRGTARGSRLIDEISAAGCTVEILKAGDGVHNACALQSAGDADGACYAEVVNVRLMVSKVNALMSGNIQSRSPVFARAREKLEKFAGYGPTRAHRRDVPTNITPQTVQRIQFGILGYWIMEDLTAGPGGDAYVYWNPGGDDCGVSDGTNPVAWSKRPAWIGLVHELIHGWRMATGRCVFHPARDVDEYYEEAMTVGLPPYDRCAYTENWFRMNASQPWRSFYGPQTKARSDKAWNKRDRRLASAL